MLIEVLSGEDFRFLWLPIITTVLTILMKILYKDRQLGWFSRSDFAIAPNLMVTAVLIVLIKVSLLAQHIQQDPTIAKEQMNIFFNKFFLFGILLFGMVATTWALREKGWTKFMVDKPILSIKAIIISDIVGVIYLIIAYNC